MSEKEEERKRRVDEILEGEREVIEKRETESSIPINCGRPTCISTAYVRCLHS